MAHTVYITFNPSTPKSDQVQISPVASPVILHHTVLRTWLFIAYSDWKMILVPVLTTSLIHFSWKGWENVLFELAIERVKAFWNFSKFQFDFHVLVLQNFYSGDAHHANCGKHILSHHLQHCPHCVYETYSVFKLFKIAVCFAHFGFYEISTVVMRIMLTMANIV